MPLNKILICDDSATDLAYLQDILVQAGYQVVAATNGKEALLKAKRERPDLILLDIIMDGMDGYKTCREISKDQITHDIPVVFVTSKNQQADLVWAQMQGARGMVSKPYTADQILQTVASVQ